MKRKFAIVIVLIMSIAIGVVAYLLPYIREVYFLSALQYGFLLMAIAVGVGIASAGIFEYIFSISLSEFLRLAHQSWNKHHDFREVVVREHDYELAEILTTMKEITASGVERIKKLESSAGYTDSYQRLITTISHQLRTPITGLNWAISSIKEDLSRGNGPDPIMVNGASDATKRIGLIIEELLIGLNNSPQAIPTDRPVDIEKSLEQVISESSLIALERQIVFSIVNKQKPLPLIKGNGREIRFVLHSLITNAVYYSQKNGTVTVTLSQDGEYVRVTVHNNGPVISDDEKATLFSQFSRGQDAVLSNPDGAGLGLYLAKQIVIEHGGTIFLKESNSTEGTTFELTFPLSSKGKLEASMRF